MKVLRLWFACGVVSLGLALLAGCSDGSGSIAGPQSPMGEPNTTFAVAGVSGVSNVSAQVTNLADGISTIAVTCQITDPTLLSLAPLIPGTQVTGSTVTGGGQARLTTNGMANVYDEGELVLVNYSASVGDTWSLDRGSYTMKRTVTAVSHTDDYGWGGMLIKTATIEETGRPLPGVAKVEYRTNHRFGLVGIKAYFEDGTTKEVSVVGSTTN